MKSSAILLAVLFLVTCGLLTTPHSHAADPPAGTGGLVATVTLANGQPAVNIKFILQPAEAAGVAPGGGGVMPHAIIGNGGAVELAGKPVSTMTNDKGEAEFKVVKAGNYVYRCGNPTKNGFAEGSAVVEPGKVTTVKVALSAPNVAPKK